MPTPSRSLSMRCLMGLSREQARLNLSIGHRKVKVLDCTDSTITSLTYPPMQVTGTFAPAAADQPGTFQLHIDSQTSTNTRYWIYT